MIGESKSTRWWIISLWVMSVPAGRYNRTIHNLLGKGGSWRMNYYGVRLVGIMNKGTKFGVYCNHSKVLSCLILCYNLCLFNSPLPCLFSHSHLNEVFKHKTLGDGMGFLKWFKATSLNLRNKNVWCQGLQYKNTIVTP